MPDWLEYVGGILIVVVVLAASIALHEVGHMVPAKRFGVKVTQYMIGFGPTVFSWRRGETEYGFKWIPAGGYIRMIGMFPPRPGEDEHHLRDSSTGAFQTLADDARHASAQEIRPGDEDRVFYKLSVPKKVVVMLGGPTMNLLIGIALLGVLLVGFGDPRNPVLTTTIEEVQVCMADASDVDALCDTDGDEGLPKTPAFEAGLRPGDEVLSYGGTPIDSWEQVRGLIRESVDTPTEVVVRRAGEEERLTVTPVPNQVAVLDDAGDAVLGDDGEPETVEAGFLGLVPQQTTEPTSVTAVPGFVWDTVTQTARLVVALPVRMVDVAQAAFGTEERDPTGPIGIVGVGRLTGEIASLDDIQTRDKVSTIIGILGQVNIALFVFNLLPLLPLDGGHVAGALWEGLRRQLARLRRKPDPGPVDVAKALPLVYVVSVVLIAMSIMLLYADIVRPITLRG